MIQDQQHAESQDDNSTVEVGGRRVMPFDAYRAKRVGELERVVAEEDRRHRERLAALRREQQRYGLLPDDAPAAVAVVAGPGVAARAAPEPSAPVDELTDHNYDGIQEYDNPTPGWWHMVFIGTVVFSGIYLFWYHFSGMIPDMTQRYELAEQRHLDLQFAELNNLPMGVDRVTAIMGEQSWLDQGATIFAQSCALCHGENGEGGVGPNMTDDFYLNTDSLGGIVTVIQDGAANGAMPAQRTLLRENDIALVAAYVASLRGQNLPGKEPEGERIAPWPEPSVGGEPGAPAGGEG